MAARRLGEVLVSPAASVLLLYTAGAVLLTRDAWEAPTSRWVGSCCDPEQYIWFVRWSAYALAHGYDPFVTHQLNSPDGVNLMWNSPALAAGFVAAPLTLLAGPVLAYNLLVTAAIALSGWCAYLLLRRYAGGQVGPAVGGALYGFSPYVIPHAALHLNLVLAAGPPLFLLILDEIVVRDRRSPRPLGIALGAVAACQLLVAEEVLATAVIAAAILLAVLAGHSRGRLRAAWRRLRPALTWATASFVLLAAWPLVVQFAGPLRIHGSVQDVELFSTDLLNLVVPTGYQLVAPDAATSVSTRFSGLAHEANAYLGFPLLILLAAWVGRRWEDARVRAATIAGGILLVLSFGPHLHIAGQSTGWPMPWLPLAHVPLLEDIEPGRLAVYVWLAVAVLVTLAVDAAMALASRRRALARLAVLAVALAAVLPAELGSSTAAVPAFFDRWGEEGIAPGSVVLVAPFFRDGGGADPMLWSAVAGADFAMPEAYAFIPGPDGRPQYGPLPTQLSDVMEHIQDTGQAVVAGGEVRERIARDLRAGEVRDVVVGPMRNRAQMLGFFTDLFGRPAESVDGVELWRDVDRQGVTGV